MLLMIDMYINTQIYIGKNKFSNEEMLNFNVCNGLSTVFLSNSMFWKLVKVFRYSFQVSIQWCSWHTGSVAITPSSASEEGVNTKRETKKKKRQKQKVKQKQKSSGEASIFFLLRLRVVGLVGVAAKLDRTQKK